MKQTKLIMGMPITVEIVDDKVSKEIFTEIFLFFNLADQQFSLYKKNSEISRINRGELMTNQYSLQMKQILTMAEQTKDETSGFFNIYNFRTRQIDPSGIVKGWAINEAAKKLLSKKIKNFYIEAGGDIQVSGHNSLQESWKVGIRNPFKPAEIIKIIKLQTEGIATSGTYERGDHLYNPVTQKPAQEIASMTVIGKNIYEADRFATAAFAMGKDGISFIEKMPGCEGYMIGYNKIATMTTGFQKFVFQS